MLVGRLIYWLSVIHQILHSCILFLKLLYPYWTKTHNIQVWLHIDFCVLSNTKILQGWKNFFLYIVDVNSVLEVLAMQVNIFFYFKNIFSTKNLLLKHLLNIHWNATFHRLSTNHRSQLWSIQQLPCFDFFNSVNLNNILSYHHKCTFMDYLTQLTLTRWIRYWYLN